MLPNLAGWGTYPRAFLSLLLVGLTALCGEWIVHQLEVPPFTRIRLEAKSAHEFLQPQSVGGRLHGNVRAVRAGKRIEAIVTGAEIDGSVLEALALDLRGRLEGRAIAKIHLAQFSALKTYQPPLSALEGTLVDDVSRHGKFLATEASGVQSG